MNYFIFWLLWHGMTHILIFALFLIHPSNIIHNNINIIHIILRIHYDKPYKFSFRPCCLQLTSFLFTVSIFHLGYRPTMRYHYSADFVAFSLPATAIRIVCTRTIPRVWRHCTCTTEGMSVSSLPSHTKLGIHHTAQAQVTNERGQWCPRSGYQCTCLIVYISRNFPIREKFTNVSI